MPSSEPETARLHPSSPRVVTGCLEAVGGTSATSNSQKGWIAMRKTLIATAVLATATLGAAQETSAWVPPCRDLAPREAVVRVHDRCDHFNVEQPQRLDLVITKPDAPARWRAAWGGDGSLAWAQRHLEWHGCASITFVGGWKAVGRDCDY